MEVLAHKPAVATAFYQDPYCGRSRALHPGNEALTDPRYKGTTMDTILQRATQHQKQAAFYADEAMLAMPLDPELAKHLQGMARFHHQRASVFLTSLLLRDPVS